jgi:hypothetical protein
MARATGQRGAPPPANVIQTANNTIRDWHTGRSSDPVPAAPMVRTAPSNPGNRFRLGDALAQHDQMMGRAPVTSVGPTVVPQTADRLGPDGSLPDPPEVLRRGR